jgi:hypothetical protein
MEIIQNGSVVANDFWNTIPFGSSSKGLNADASNGISHRFLLKIRTADADIDGRRIICQTREWGKTYSEFKINGTSRGQNVAALTYSDDLNNTTLEATVSGYTTIANTEGYRLIDVNNDTTTEPYYSEWDKDTYSINQFYERMKWLTRRGSASTIYGINGEVFRGITHEIVVDTPTGTFSNTELISWPTGTGILLAINSTTAATKIWIQHLTGVAPIDNQVITGGTSSATVTVNVTITERSVSTPFCGVSTGATIIGAYGFGIQALDLTANDKVFDLNNTQRQAPNYVTFTVTGLVSGEDSIMVAPNNAGSIDTAQLTLSGTLNGAAVTSVVVSASIPADTPATGTIRILRANGVFTKHSYTSWTASTFTIASTDFSANNATTGTQVYISYIDRVATGVSETFTAIYTTDRSLFVRVRDGGGTPIKTFESTALLGSSGGSVTVIRTSDA